MKLDISNIIKNLKKNGYITLKTIIPQKISNQAKLDILKLKRNLKKNKKFIDEASLKGQEIIRDLPLRNSDAFLKFIDLKSVMKILEKIFNDSFILDNMMASNSLNVLKKYDRKIHIDSQLPINQFNFTTDVVVMIYLDKFKIENGATKVWPGSHKSGSRIHHEKMINKKKFNKPKYLIGEKGSISIMLGQTWHQVGKNTTNNDRWSIFLHYKRWWMKPSTNFLKCGKKIFKKLNSKQKELFGFNSISPSYDFINKTKKIYTLRKVKSLSKNYKKVLNY